jgi:hypothetical protein
MRTTSKLIIAFALNAGLALAGEPKTLYVKAHEAKVLKEPDAAADELGTVKFGDEVTWLEAAKRPFHKVSATVKAAPGPKKKKDKNAGKEVKVEGYLLQQSLTANKPQEEIAGTGEHKLSAQAFASSGAATKAMSEAGLKYAARKDEKDKKANMALAVKGIISAEALAKDVATREATEKEQDSFGCKVNGGCK